MAVGVINWALGANQTILITPQVRGADGAFSDHAIGSLSFEGRIDSSDAEVSLATENLSPADCFLSNPVPYEQSGTYVITEIACALPLVTASNKGFGYSNVLRAVASKSFYHKITLQLFDIAGTKVDEQIVYVLMTQPQKRTMGKNRIVDQATFQLIAVVNTSTGAYEDNPDFGSYA